MRWKLWAAVFRPCLQVLPRGFDAAASQVGAGAGSLLAHFGRFVRHRTRRAGGFVGRLPASICGPVGLVRFITSSGILSS